MNQILSPEKFLQILSHYLLDTNEGFIVVDAESEDQPIVYVNRGFTNITHYSITLNDVTVQKHNAEYNSLKSTLETVNDIVFNYMSYLNELRMELKDIFSADTNDEQNNLLKEFDVEYSDTIKKLLALDQIKDYKEKRVGKKVTLLNLE